MGPEQVAEVEHASRVDRAAVGSSGRLGRLVLWPPASRCSSPLFSSGPAGQTAFLSQQVRPHSIARCVSTEVQHLARARNTFFLACNACLHPFSAHSCLMQRGIRCADGMSTEVE
eukprot:10990379-Alexandrium_andersonii.AAC.1